jgi:hypothetical protein
MRNGGAGTFYNAEISCRNSPPHHRTRADQLNERKSATGLAETRAERKKLACPQRANAMENVSFAVKRAKSSVLQRQGNGQDD